MALLSVMDIVEGAGLRQTAPLEVFAEKIYTFHRQVQSV